MPKSLDTKYICSECAAESGRIPGIFKENKKCSLCHKERVCSLSVVATPQRHSSPSRHSDSGEYIVRCPECEEPIEHLNTRADVVEYGSVDVGTTPGSTGDCWDTNDSETIETRFYCPECDEEISTSSLIWTPAEEDNEDSHKD